MKQGEVVAGTVRARLVELRAYCAGKVAEHETRLGHLAAPDKIGADYHAERTARLTDTRDRWAGYAAALDAVLVLPAGTLAGGTPAPPITRQ